MSNTTEDCLDLPHVFNKVRTWLTYQYKHLTNRAPVSNMTVPEEGPIVTHRVARHAASRLILKWILDHPVGLQQKKAPWGNWAQFEIFYAESEHDPGESLKLIVKCLAEASAYLQTASEEFEATDFAEWYWTGWGPFPDKPGYYMGVVHHRPLDCPLTNWPREAEDAEEPPPPPPLP